MVLPAICGLAEKYDRVYLAMYNRQVFAIADLPPNVVDILQSEPRWVNEKKDVLWLAAGAACDYDPGKQPARSLIWRFMERAGLVHSAYLDTLSEEELIATLPQPKVKVSEAYRPYDTDVILAPWTTASQRTMTQEQARDLRDALYLKYHLLVVGGENDPRCGPDLYGAAFEHVGGMMLRTRCVVSVDSFPGRLAHAVGVKKHIVLDSTVTPWITQAHPGAIRVKGRLEGEQAMWDIDEIVAAVDEALERERPLPWDAGRRRQPRSPDRHHRARRTARSR